MNEKTFRSSQLAKQIKEQILPSMMSHALVSLSFFRSSSMARKKAICREARYLQGTPNLRTKRKPGIKNCLPVYRVGVKERANEQGKCSSWRQARGIALPHGSLQEGSPFGPSIWYSVFLPCFVLPPTVSSVA
jgi:hypothetical protein